ncbi:MAG: DUF4249 domain-containing protein [Bacteroidales bacterium]|nr:DUF4249 domain-containing protein [Bacteroidales bacterium]
MKKLIYIIIASAIVLTACEKTLDFPFEYKQPKLVLNCVLSSTSEIDFTVSRSMHILDSKEIVMIPDADVIIFEDGNPLQVVPVSDGEGNYHAAYIPKAGHTYKFQVSKDKFETIEAEVKMGEPTTINSLSGKNKYESDQDVYYYGANFDINLNFNDNPNEENYYMINVSAILPDELVEYFRDNYYSYEMLDSTYRLNLECNDMYVSTSSNNTLLYLSDEIISSGNYTMKFSAQDYRDIYGVFYEIEYYNDNEDEDENITEDPEIEDLPFYREYEYMLVVHVKSVNKDYYQYQKSYDLYIENDGNPFAEPTLVKTNVKNGLGILGTASEVTDTIRFTVKNPYLEEDEYDMKRRMK